MGADLNNKEIVETSVRGLLLAAIFAGYAEIVELLLAYGADLEL